MASTCCVYLCANTAHFVKTINLSQSYFDCTVLRLKEFNVAAVHAAVHLSAHQFHVMNRQRDSVERHGQYRGDLITH